MPEIRPVAGANVWHGKDMAQSVCWRRRLTPAQLAEIDAALGAARARGLPWEAMTADDFPLPGLAPLFDDIREELENGSGLLMLRGIDPTRYTFDDAKVVYAGLCRQLGTLVYSNRGGEIMREIRDVGRDVGKRYGELPGSGQDGAFLSSYSRTLSNGSLRYHTDRCDVVSLFCVRQAMKGGLSRLCSSPAVHNAMLERRPELAAALYEDVWRSRFGEEDEGDSLGYKLPVWSVRDGKFTSHYSRTFVEAGQRRPEAPRVSAAQWEALDLLSDLADELCFEMSFTPGDIQFVNNHVIYHARTEFEDDAGAGRDRLLLRLWMAMPNSRALPAGHEVLWGDIAAGARRGGIGQTATAPLR
ncbi:MAG TPA: TauD/TfdA family dioxygenase [Stellaceae bacterium]|nr:TauD/TfdA family dioxygenase [Stellaceae bacterium]